jgi:hypothetical protein
MSTSAPTLRSIDLDGRFFAWSQHLALIANVGGRSRRNSLSHRTRPMSYQPGSSVAVHAFDHHFKALVCAP